MSTEQEVIETTETVDDAPAETVEAVDSEPVEEAVEAAEPAESIEESAPAVYDWNGEVEGLKQSEWFGKLDPNLQSALMDGFETKYNHWQRGYNDKFKEMSDSRRTLDRREKDVRDQEIRVQRWLNGDVDPLAEKQKEIDEIKTMHRSAMETLRGEFDEVTRKATEASQGELQEVIRERESLRQESEARQQAEAQLAQQEMDEAVHEFDTWLKDTAPDIQLNPDAHKTLVSLIIEDIDPNEAIKMVRVKWPVAVEEAAPEPEPTPEPETVPDSVDMMNMGAGSGTTETGDYRSIEDILDGMRRSAQLDASTVMGLKI